MRLTIVAVGRLKAGPERELVDRYRKRLRTSARQTGIGPLQIREIAQSRRGSTGERREQEARAIASAVPASATLVALDETGDALSTADLAALLEAVREAGAGELVFAIGGPDGHGAAVTERAHRTLSLGTMTLPHGLARIVLAEQLYRAVTILSGHPYHRP